MLTHRALSPKQDWQFFNNEDVTEEQFLAEIFPFTESSSREIWRTYICANPQSRHPQLLPDFAWAYKILTSENTAYWQSDWEDEDGSSSLFYDWLCQTITWPLNTRIVFSWSAEYSVETSWGAFYKHWRYFLFDDEGPILWSLQHSEAIRFMPNGWAYAGRRDTPTETA